ncbi:MAG: hypothetical protein ACHRHE_07850 [Tepidisphaerales bacterium]
MVVLLAWPLFAEDPNAAFDSLFGKEAKTVKASANAADKVQFAKTLLDAASKVSADKPLQAILYNQAFEFALLASPEGYPLATQAMESLAKAQPEQKAGADKKLLLVSEKQYRTAGGPQRVAAGMAYLARLVELADSQMAAQRWDEAVANYRQAAPVAAQVDPAQSADIAARIKSVAERREMQQRVGVLRKRLEKDARDASAAADLIRILLVDTGQPEEAAKYASATSDAMLKLIVQLNQKSIGALEEDEALELGKWYRAQIAGATATGKANAAGRATECYQRFLALHRTEDARRLAATMALQEVKKVGAAAKAAVNSRRLVNLMPLIDSARDAVEGKWVVSKDGLQSDDTAHAHLRIRYQPPEEYDYQIEFTRVSGNNDVVQMMSHAGHSFNWGMALSGNKLGGLERIGRAGVENSNPTLVRLNSWFTNGQRYRSVVQIRNDSVTTLVNGKVVLRYDTDYGNLTAPGIWSVGEGVLGVGSWDSPTLFHSIEIVEITGQGRPLPEDK